MLIRQVVRDVVFYASPLLQELNVGHGFSTRLGGLSAAPFDSLNLGNPNGCAIQDDEEQIAQNYRRFESAIGCGNRKRFWVHQVHGGEVITATAGDAVSQKADAIVTQEPGLALAVRTADCVPILLASEDGRTVAAVHAGWRGVIAQACRNAIERMNVAPARLTAAIGPSIGFDAFEVGPEVLAAFETAFPADPPIRRRRDGKGTIDLRQAVRRQLIDAGIQPDRIDTTDRCTYRDREEFFSHRRDNGVTGRMAAIIARRV